MSVMVEKSCLKVRGDAKELAEAIGIAASVAPSKSPRPVLQNLLLDARDGVLEVTGTDLDVAIRVRIERVDVTSEGRVLVNAARFQQILRELVGEQVEIETDERAGCIISTGDSRFHVMGEEPDDFPELGAWKGDGVLQLPASALVEMIRRTHFAAHPEKTRYAMNGILIDLKDQRLRLVATDGKRLSMCERPTSAEAVKAPVFVVVPTKAMQLLQRVVGSGEEHVEVSVEPAQVQFRTAHATVMARLIEGHFPPYEDVLPK
ncbi:MAG: DNA polymerase III subunit beta, partial [Planctomycetota bacterium]|nr:DNA polymerase III subunit beta [Planctomycetota bacterium]